MIGLRLDGERLGSGGAPPWWCRFRSPPHCGLRLGFEALFALEAQGPVSVVVRGTVMVSENWLGSTTVSIANAVGAVTHTTIGRATYLRINSGCVLDREGARHCRSQRCTRQVLMPWERCVAGTERVM